VDNLLREKKGSPTIEKLPWKISGAWEKAAADMTKGFEVAFTVACQDKTGLLKRKKESVNTKKSTR